MGYLRRLPRFEYLAPRSVVAVCDVLAEYPGEARLLAGGTDLILQMRRREVAPRYIIGLKGLSELAFIRPQKNGGVAIGAMTTVRTIEFSPLIRERYGLLCRTAAEMGSPEIRQSATIGGNLAGALPCADFPPALITLGAHVKLKSQQGERLLPLEEFFLGPEQTVVDPSELVTEIQLPAPSPLSDGAYVKFHDRHAMDMTTTGVSAFVTLDQERRRFRDVKIALASSAPIPLRAKNAEAALRGQAFTEKVVEKAAALACQEAQPRSSWRASRDLRLELIKSLTKRAIRQAWEKAKAPSNGGRP